MEPALEHSGSLAARVRHASTTARQRFDTNEMGLQTDSALQMIGEAGGSAYSSESRTPIRQLSSRWDEGRSMKANAIHGLELADLVKRRTIIAVAGDDFLMERLVFKGGNALVYIHGITGRGSYDLDFSMEGEFEDIELLKVAMSRALRASFAEVSLIPFDLNVEFKPSGISDDMKTFWGGYAVEFKLITSVKHQEFQGDLELIRRNALTIGPSGSGTKFQIDISLHEYCGGQQRVLFENYALAVYSPMAIVCEKLRAICQQMPEYGPIVKRSQTRQGRAADFLDICAVLDRFAIDIRSDSFLVQLKRTFEAKKVPLQFLDLVESTYSMQEVDFERVRATVAQPEKLETFAAYFQRIVALCSDLKSLWDK